MIKLFISYIIAFQIAAIISTCFLLFLFLIIKKLTSLFKRKFTKSDLLMYIILCEIITQSILIPFSYLWFKDSGFEYWEWIAASIPFLSIISCILKFRYTKLKVDNDIKNLFHEEVEEHVYK